MRHACCEGAERGGRLPLPREGFHVAYRLEEALDQMHPEREPGAHPFPKRLGGDSQHHPRAGPAAGRQVPDVLRPRPEPAGPHPRPVHHPGHRFLPPGAAQQLHPPRQQHPPKVGGLAFTERHIAAVEGHLIAGRYQVAKLLVAKPLEQEDAAQVIDEHQPNLPGATSGPVAGTARPNQCPMPQRQAMSRAIAC